ncbi:MAG: hypothetical protein ABI960_10520 [Candidatus Eisenbacteria bacterium]
MRANPQSPVRHALVLLAACLLAGCGGGAKGTIGPPPPPPQVTKNDTPANALQCFLEAYDQKLDAPYAALFTSDFHFTFSADTDPSLVVQYGPNWSKDDEAQSATHLFHGFTSGATGTYLPGATHITMALNSVQFFDDPAHTDSTDSYKWATVARVVLAVEVPGNPDPQVYNIDARQEFYLVRGDAAVLDAGQEARADRWYIRRWDDLSTNLAAPARPALDAGDPPTPTRAATWGSLKSQYR